MTLFLFSIVGTLRTWPEFLHGLATRGVHYTVCDTHFLDKVDIQLQMCRYL